MDRYSKLYTAIKDYDLTKVVRLFNKGVDIHHRNKYSCTFLHWAASYGNAEIAAFLIERGAAIDTRTNCDFTPLHFANCARTAELLLDAGADITAINGITPKGQWQSLGNTPVHTAVWHNRMDVVQVLVKAGANIDAKNAEGITALHEAAGCLSPETVRAIIDHGADVEILDSEHHSPLWHALEQNRLDNAQALVDSGVCIDADLEEKLLKALNRS